MSYMSNGLASSVLSLPRKGPPNTQSKPGFLVMPIPFRGPWGEGGSVEGFPAIVRWLGLKQEEFPL
jgi:hypothetical protein